MKRLIKAGDIYFVLGIIILIGLFYGIIWLIPPIVHEIVSTFIYLLFIGIMIALTSGFIGDVLTNKFEIKEKYTSEIFTYIHFINTIIVILGVWFYYDDDYYLLKYMSFLLFYFPCLFLYDVYKSNRDKNH